MRQEQEAKEERLAREEEERKREEKKKRWESMKQMTFLRGTAGIEDEAGDAAVAKDDAERVGRQQSGASAEGEEVQGALGASGVVRKRRSARLSVDAHRRVSFSGLVQSVSEKKEQEEGMKGGGGEGGDEIGQTPSSRSQKENDDVRIRRVSQTNTGADETEAQRAYHANMRRRSLDNFRAFVPDFELTPEELQSMQSENRQPGQHAVLNTGETAVAHHKSRASAFAAASAAGIGQSFDMVGLSEDGGQGTRGSTLSDEAMDLSSVEKKPSANSSFKPVSRQNSQRNAIVQRSPVSSPKGSPPTTQEGFFNPGARTPGATPRSSVGLANAGAAIVGTPRASIEVK